MDDRMRVPQPARGFEVGQARAQAFGDDIRCRLGFRFEARQRVLGAGEGTQQWVIVIGLRRGLACAQPAGRIGGIVMGFPCRPKPAFELVFRVARHFCVIVTSY